MAGNGLTQQQRFWLDHVKGCTSSGLSMRDYADRHGFDVQQFYSWKVESKKGAVAFRQRGVAVAGGFRQLPVPQSSPWLRFLSSLIKPDVRSYRIRLSDWLHITHTALLSVASTQDAASQGRCRRPLEKIGGSRALPLCAVAQGNCARVHRHNGQRSDSSGCTSRS